MNDTPQGDGNIILSFYLIEFYKFLIRMNDTPQGDGNIRWLISIYEKNKTFYKNE